jgi:AraC-like DNA-binding protein
MDRDARYWAYTLDRDFPLRKIHYTTRSAKDPFHWHDYLEIGLCTGGSGDFLFPGVSYPIGPGDVFVLNNYEKHVAHAALDTELCFDFLLFLPELFMRSGSNDLDYGYLHPFWLDRKDFCHRIPADNPLAARIRHEFGEITPVGKDCAKQERYLCESSLRKLLALVRLNYQRCIDRENPHVVARRVSMQKALDYIQEHFDENITLGDLAGETNLSVSHFRHRFRQVMFMNFKEYLVLVRIQKAKQLLLTTDMSIHQVILQVGYSNEHYFYGIFKDMVHMTPSEFRSGNPERHPGQ